MWCWLLACGGPKAPVPSPAPPATWVDEAVAEALAFEVMPGTTGEPDPSRAPALAAFFAAHPEYADRDRRAELARHACAVGTEQAHELLTNPAPREPVVVEVQGPEWRILVAHAEDACTSDDWSFYVNEIAEAAGSRGVVAAYGGVGSDAVSVVLGGAEVARFPLSGQGFLVAKAGKPAKDLGYATTSEVMAELEAYLAR